jgi:exopolysaccharide biosynthesis predicted pyruvyltransferase EpsI
MERNLFINDPFSACLRGLAGGKCYVKHYLGNSGDELIFAGVSHLLRECGVIQTFNEGHADFILWPGGNPTMWKANIDGWREVLQEHGDKPFVIAPGTFEGRDHGWVEVLNGASTISHVFARDVKSFEVLGRQCGAGQFERALSHDPALALLNSEWLKVQRDSAERRYTLIAMRDDHEACLEGRSGLRGVLLKTMPAVIRRKLEWRDRFGQRIGRLEAIASSLPKGECVRMHDVSAANPSVFYDTIRQAKEVHTDRLHVMLMAAMLGKPVVAYATSYGKLESVYQRSLAGWADVTFRQFVDQRPVPPHAA